MACMSYDVEEVGGEGGVRVDTFVWGKMATWQQLSGGIRRYFLIFSLIKKTKS